MIQFNNTNYINKFKFHRNKIYVIFNKNFCLLNCLNKEISFLQRDLMNKIID